MKISRICAIVFLLLLGFTVAAGKAEPVEKLRQDALSGLRQFTAAWPETRAAERARAILQQETAAPDPQRWIGEILRFATAALREHPPTSNQPEFRRAVQEILDFPLRIENSDPKLPAGFNQFWKGTVDSVYQPIFDRMLLEIADAKVESGARVWKAYNMGFIVKTPNHTFGFDLRAGATLTRAYTAEQLAQLTRLLDAIFISHNHGDHVDAGLAAAMLAAGKTVVRPTEKTLSKLTGYTGLLTLYDDHREAVDIAGLSVRAFPGIQGVTEPCAVYLVTADGVSITQNGDNQSVFPYRMMRKYAPVDLALANSWSGFAPFLFAVKPKLAVIGHEHELTHKVSGRDPFETVYRRLAEEPPAGPVVVMDCGESITIPSNH